MVQESGATDDMVMKIHDTLRLMIIIPPLVIIVISCEVAAFSFPPFTQSHRMEAMLQEKFTKITKLEATSQLDNPAWKEGGKVMVQVVKDVFPDTSPREVSEAWMEHHWRRGGGLPIFVVSGPFPETSWTEAKRTIYPIAMEECILLSKGAMVEEKDPDDDTAAVGETPTITIRYHVSEAGPFFVHLVPGSHHGTVTISPGKMIWKVEFETTQLRALYQTVTEFTLGVAARTVQEACGPTRLLTLRAMIPSYSVDASFESPKAKSIEGTSVMELRRELLDFFWARGGGLPLIPPIPVGDVLEDGGGMARTKLLRIPPLITESIISTTDIQNGDCSVADVVYHLENPGWLTFPFLLHTHLGRIQLIAPSSADGDYGPIELIWQVEIRPYPLASPLVEKLVDMTICTIVRNFLVHLEEPGSTVLLMLPGKATISSPNNDSDMPRGIRIPRASWWGGAIEKCNALGGQQEEADLLDRVTGVFTPWTWGRTGNESEDGDVLSVSWIDGEKINL